jgi:hypothetical protein
MGTGLRGGGRHLPINWILGGKKQHLVKEENMPNINNTNILL